MLSKTLYDSNSPSVENYLLGSTLFEEFADIEDLGIQDMNSFVQEFEDELLEDEDEDEIEELGSFKHQENKYYNSHTWIQKSRKSKLNQLWGEINQDTSSWAFPGILEQGKIFISDQNMNFKTPGDAMNPLPWPLGIRQKYTHQVGAVGKVKFVSRDNHDYTGVYRGADAGIIRLSSTTNPNEYGYMSPSMGLKFLRDGIDSANLVSMFGLDGTPGDWNFFSGDFTNNHINWSVAPQIVALAKKFSYYTDMIQSVGNSNMANQAQDGRMEETPNFPFSLTFKPDSELKAKFPSKLVNGNKMQYLDQLKAVPENHRLYEVWALDKPYQLGGKQLHIGDLVLDGKMTTSKWGDQNLFYRHQKMDDDLKIHPEWKPYVPLESLTGKCPYQHLLNLF